MEQVVVKNIHFGDGTPKICVPIVCRSDEEILKQADFIMSEARRLEEQYPEQRLDMIEFRADYYDNITNSTMLDELLEKLREVLDDRILLFTYRSEEEGGELRHDRAENMVDDIYDNVMASRLVDMVDVELLSGNYRVARTTTKAHDSGMKCVVSCHDFSITPRDDKLLEMLRNMEILGGDILKIATTPKNAFDTRRIIELTENINTHKLAAYDINKPIVMISMGTIGQPTRIARGDSGSAFTFASVGQGSAPGQFSLEEMFKEFSRKNG